MTVLTVSRLTTLSDRPPAGQKSYFCVVIRATVDTGRFGHAQYSHFVTGLPSRGPREMTTL